MDTKIQDKVDIILQAAVEKGYELGSVELDAYLQGRIDQIEADRKGLINGN